MIEEVYCCGNKKTTFWEKVDRKKVELCIRTPYLMKVSAGSFGLLTRRINILNIVLR